MDEGTWISTTYRPTKAAAIISQILLALTGVIAALSGLVLVDGFAIVEAAAYRTGGPAEAALLSWVSLLEALGSAQILLSLVTAVVFLVWQYRAVANVPLLGGGTPRWSPGWSVAWWFVPVAFLFMPFLVMRELSKRLTVSPGDDTYVIAGWWISFIGAVVVSRASAVLPLDNVIDLMRWQLLSQAMFTIAAVLAIIMIGRLETYGSERVTDHPPPAPTAPRGVSAPGSVSILLTELAQLHAAGVITDREFETKKTELLARM